MATALVAVIVVAVLVGAAVLVAAGWVRRAATAGRRAALAAAGGEELVRQADVNSFGRASLGLGQVRGNATLVLTDRSLVLAQWVPARTVRIPLDAVTEVSTPRSHLGKTRGVRLLRVSWRQEDGAVDELGLQVQDLEGWLADLDVQRP